MNALLAVALGGAIGAVARYLCAALLTTPGSVFPWATLTINIAGSFLIGLIWGMYAHADWFVHWGRAFVVVGILGGFTTFSAFSLELVLLVQAQKFAYAGLYALASVGLCLLGTYAGLRVVAHSTGA